MRDFHQNIAESRNFSSMKEFFKTIQYLVLSRPCRNSIKCKKLNEKYCKKFIRRRVHSPASLDTRILEIHSDKGSDEEIAKKERELNKLDSNPDLDEVDEDEDEDDEGHMSLWGHIREPLLRFGIYHILCSTLLLI